MDKDSGAEFPKSARLLTARDYRRVFDDARAFRHPAFTLLVRENQVGRPRLGLILAKKNVRLSVQRNRIKRLARESFRASRQRLPAVDIIFLARRGIDKLDNARIRQALTKQWRRISTHFSPNTG
ncbi:MAG TPA: ribonuclease P protein component [Gammaproteobacteria bacterium]|nr:ribonuclease P protein component [Gammaproteobacteria bacterium]